MTEGRKCILLTGATGAIGSVTAGLLLDQPETEVVLLLRANSEQHLHQRLQQLAHFWQRPIEPLLQQHRLSAIIGDTQLPNLGLKQQEYHNCVKKITHIIHAAGNVKLNLSAQQADSAAINPTTELIALATKACGSGSFKKMEYISTVGVAGRIGATILEQRIVQPRQYRNSYEAAKAKAEDLIWQAIDQQVPITVHRPSMVIGDSSTGATIHFQVFYHLIDFLSGRRTYGCLPNPGETYLDVIPVDIVAKALLLSCSEQSSVGTVFHLAAGPAGAVLIRDLIAKIRHYFTVQGDEMPRVRFIAKGWFELLTPLIAALSPAKTRKMVKNLHYFLAYLDQPQFFDNTNSAKLLEKNGASIPRFEDYFDNIMNYFYLHAKGCRR